MSDAPRWEVEGRDWPNRSASRFVTTPGMRWHVQVMGDGPVLLLLHGTGAATHSWRDVMPALAADFTVVAPDLPGHGFTTGRPTSGLTMPAVARAVATLLAAVSLDPAAIVGHSAGAAVALRMTLDRLATPRALVGLDAALLPFPGLGALLFPGLARLLFANPFASHLFARIARTPGETARFLAHSTGSRIDTAGARCYEQLFATPSHCAGAMTMMAAWDLAALQRDLPGLEVPLLLVHGENDSAIPLAKAREAAELIPGASLHPLPKLGHLAHEEQPDTVAGIIREFLETHR